MSQTEREDSMVGEHILRLLHNFLEDERLQKEATLKGNSESASLLAGGRGSSSIGKLSGLIDLPPPA